jgi:hypothetical protein
MELIEGMENSVLFVFIGLMSFILYIFWNILKYIMERRERPSQFHVGNENNDDPNDQYHGVAANEDCSICTERMKYKVELDCSHSYCSKCIIEYYDRIMRPRNLKCPLCRREVRLINAQNIRRNENNREYYDKIVEYNHKNLNGFNYVRKFIILVFCIFF